MAEKKVREIETNEGKLRKQIRDVRKNAIEEFYQYLKERPEQIELLENLSDEQSQYMGKKGDCFLFMLKTSPLIARTLPELVEKIQTANMLWGLKMVEKRREKNIRLDINQYDGFKRPRKIKIRTPLFDLYDG